MSASLSEPQLPWDRHSAAKGLVIYGSLKYRTLLPDNILLWWKPYNVEIADASIGQFAHIFEIKVTLIKTRLKSDAYIHVASVWHSRCMTIESTWNIGCWSMHTAWISYRPSKILCTCTASYIHGLLIVWNVAPKTTVYLFHISHFTDRNRTLRSCITEILHY